MMKHHIKGWLGKGDEDWDYGLTITENKEESYPSSLGDVINSELEGSYEPSKQQKPNAEHEDGVDVSLYIPDTSIRVYATEKESTLQEAIEKMLLNSFGEFDIYQEWTGYSEWTIMGFDLRNMTIGNHDLLQILESYVGKYVHILIET